MNKARQALALSKGSNHSERKVTNAKGAKIPVNHSMKGSGKTTGSRGDSGGVTAPHTAHS